MYRAGNNSIYILIVLSVYILLFYFIIGIEYNLDSIINKWKKLKQQYKEHLDKQKKSGTERRKKWKFFGEMDQICGHRDTSSPACLIDSSLPHENAGMVFFYYLWGGRGLYVSQIYMLYVIPRNQSLKVIFFSLAPSY